MLFKHKKTGGIYEFLGLAVGVDGPGIPTMVLYRRAPDSLLPDHPDAGAPIRTDDEPVVWVRSAEAFFRSFEPYLFFESANLATDFEGDFEEESEPSQTIGEALEIQHSRETQS